MLKLSAGAATLRQEGQEARRAAVPVTVDARSDLVFDLRQVAQRFGGQSVKPVPLVGKVVHRSPPPERERIVERFVLRRRSRNSRCTASRVSSISIVPARI